MEMSDFGIRRPLTFHILMFSSKTACPNEQKLSSYGWTSIKIAHFVLIS